MEASIERENEQKRKKRDENGGNYIVTDYETMKLISYWDKLVDLALFKFQ